LAALDFVPIAAQPPERFRPLLGDSYREIEEAAERGRRVLNGRTIWHVNSTASGGGVVELLYSLLPYVRGAGIDTRWAVIGGDAEFFRVTKRLHNNLHGALGDRGALGPAERRVYEGALENEGRRLAKLVRREDVIYLHDPQTAGLIPVLEDTGTHTIWRCHIGIDDPNDVVRRAWRFLLPYIERADAYVFSKRDYIWEGLDEGRVWILPPSIDPLSPKNQDLDEETVAGILGTIGLSAAAPARAPTFLRADGTPARVERRAEIVQDSPLPEDAPLVAQVSRWDRLKDPAGLLECFAHHLPDPDAHLLLAGPATGAVADDPEGAAVLDEVTASWRGLPGGIRRRVHLVSLPMDDREENAAMVNALQRRPQVVVQKSLAEGFGLTVLEAMWKARPVVASGVGGIRDQIVDGESGILIEDPRDLAAFGSAILDLLHDARRAAQMGTAARLRVMEGFLGVRKLVHYLDLVAGLDHDGE
jgi:trehalose synthase